MMRFALALACCNRWRRRCIGQSGAADANWPDRPLRMIVPLPAGSAVDVIARLIGQRLSARLGQPVIVENRAGASGIIGADAVAKAAPDGYTLGMATSTTHMTAPVLNAKLPYDPVKDFAPVAIVGISPYVLVVNPKVPAKDDRRADRAGKGEAKTLSYSSVGNASQAHLAGELFASNGRRRAQPHSLQDLDPRGHRPERGPHRHAVRHSRHQPGAHPRGQAPRARGHDRDSGSRSCPTCRP